MLMAGAAPSPRRFRPAFLPTAATAVFVALFVVAGVWQHARMEQKLALRAELDAAARNAPVPLPAPGDWGGWRFRPVIARGTFDAAHQIYIDNRIRAGRVGYDVVAPLTLDDGRKVLVDRGFIPAGATRSELPAAPPPAGEVALVGRVNEPAKAYLELASDTVQGPLWQNLDARRYARVTGIDVLPIVVEQTAPIDAADALERDWPAPDFGAERHLVYMVQWFVFAALAAGLWAYFTWRRRR